MVSRGNYLNLARITLSDAMEDFKALQARYHAIIDEQKNLSNRSQVLNASITAMVMEAEDLMLELRDGYLGLKERKELAADMRADLTER